jgi:hypothetical protein
VTDSQLYLSVGIPSVLALVNLAIILTLFTSLRSDVQELRGALRDLVGAINDVDKRLTRVEIKLGIQP